MYADLLAAADAHATDFAHGALVAWAERGFGLVTCMDSRIDPAALFALAPGDAKVLRNAGGRVTDDVLRSLVLATTTLGVTRVAVMHHSGCALAHRDDAAVRALLDERQRVETAAWDFLAMPDPDASLRADVARVVTCPALPAGVSVVGWRYDVASGSVAEVVAESRTGSPAAR